MKIPTTLLYRVLLNEGLQVNVAVERDFQEIESRFEHEGMSFLTITLPALDDTLLMGLAGHRITPSLFKGFRPFRRGGNLPGLLSGFFMRVFDNDGRLKEHPCIDSIRAIRQVTRLFKKVELPCSAARVKQAFERYVSNDESVHRTSAWSPSSIELVRNVAGYLWSDLEELSGELYCFPGIFGTGATAEKYGLNERHTIRQWPSRGEASFPSDYHTTPFFGDKDSLAGIVYLEEEDEQPVRVVQVPKTLKTPRIISVEPSYRMLQQQSIAKPLMDYLERDFPYKSINFTSQDVNKDMARIGSIDGSLSTIDLSDASDLVSNDLVKLIFSHCPTFLDFLQDARSLRAQLPDSSVINLRKYASQGSALCFPVEAMVFFTLLTASLVLQSGRRLSRDLLTEVTAKTSVYGDDIIVPTETANGVMDMLEAFGLRVNHGKSFATGFFRESCGGDYYRGHDVTPSYVRQWDFSGHSREPHIVTAYVSLSNQFYSKGLWHASQHIRDHLDKIFRYRPLPVASGEPGYLHFRSVRRTDFHGWHPGFQRPMVKGVILRAKSKIDNCVDLRGVLLRAFQPSYHSESRRFLGQRSEDRRSCGFNGGDASCQSRYRSSLSHHSQSLFSEGRDWTVPNGTPDLFRTRIRNERLERLRFLEPSFPIDFSKSVDSYSSTLKNRWCLTAR